MAAEPFVGRTQELQALSEALDRVLSGQEHLCLLVGEAGIGKTRLAAEFAAHARNREVRVVWGRSWGEEQAPALWPWQQALRQIDPSFEPALQSSPIPTATKTFDAFIGVVELLKEHCALGPLVVILDDLHVADELSLELLSFVARVPEDLRLLLIGAYDEVDARRSPRRARLLAHAGREGKKIPLNGFARSEVAELFAALSDLDAPEWVIDDLYRATGGNPFFLIETIRLFLTKGDIRRPDHSIGFRVPAGVRDVILDRLDPLDAATREALSVAAVIGKEFDVNVLAPVLGRDITEALDILAHAVQAGMIEEESGLGRYTFNHRLVRETLYEELPVSRRMQVHRRVAEELEARSTDDDLILPDLAHHWFKAAQAGDPDKALAYVTRAAERAAITGAKEEASRLYQRALQLASRGASGGTSVYDLEAALESLASDTDRSRETVPTRTESARFAREGDFWTIEYAGGVTRLRHTKGLAFIAYLLERPSQEIHVFDIVAAVEGMETRRVGGGEGQEQELRIGADDAGEILDPAARRAYKARINELEEEIEEARSFNDDERAVRAQEELDTLVQQLAEGFGIGGRPRKAISQSERARIRVRKTVKDALGKIAASAPGLGEHFSATIRTGTYCSYVPDPRVAIRWET